MNIDIKRLTLSKIAELLESAEISSAELCSKYLDHFKATEPKINAFLSINEEDIIRESELSDARKKNGKTLSRFDGIPIAIKDLINVKDQPCTCGSKILENYISVYDATVISKLRAKGFILFGRTNMDEFAMGSSCENSAYGITKNPWDIDRVPGGSSGGSAAAVSASEVPAALGSDTGGSVREPAAFCGVVGLKPTYGKVSRYGLVAFASSFDQIGPITKNVQDSAILLDIISGCDPKDSTSLPDFDLNYENLLKTVGSNLKGVTVGFPREYLQVDELDSHIRKTVDKSIELLKSLGAKLIEISLPYTKYGIAAYYVIATAEASANLARFDGVRYGKRTEKYNDLASLYLQTRGNYLGDEVKRRILLGTFVLSSGYHDAYYLKAQKVRTLIRNDFNKAFKKCDIIFSPSTPTLPVKIGEISDPVQMYLLDIFTVPINLAGVCAINVPADIVNYGGKSLPVGVQFIGPAMREDKLFKVAKIFEDKRDIKEFIPGL